jgi:hypothetical protein
VLKNCLTAILVCVLSAAAVQAQTQTPQQPSPVPAPKGVTPSEPVSLELFHWISRARPDLLSGEEYPGQSGLHVRLPKEQVGTPGLLFSLPAGAGNALRFRYLRTWGRGATTLANDTFVFGENFDQNDTLGERYTLQNFKVSLDYLSWPFPLNDRRFKLRTLWEVQYLSAETEVEGPPTTDSEGNVSRVTAKDSNWFVLPTFGLAASYAISRNVRWEIRGSGFGLPNRSAIGDASTEFGFRAGKLEILIGGKGFYFRTSRRQEYRWKDTLLGGYAGLRWYLN